MNAVRIYVANLMTEPGETDHYSLDDHLRVDPLHAGFDLFDYILVNRRPIETDAAASYASQGSTPVKLMHVRCGGPARRRLSSATSPSSTATSEFDISRSRSRERSGRWSAPAGPEPARTVDSLGYPSTWTIFLPARLAGISALSAAPINSSAVSRPAKESDADADRHRHALCCDRS